MRPGGIKWLAFGFVACAMLLLGFFLAREYLTGFVRYAEVETPPTEIQIARGEYLARLGNCAGCHTDRGGRAYAGGKAINTPFGAIFATNLTPDAATGIGSWDSRAFYRAMRYGRTPDGRFLYPAFPYQYFANITREDSDALFAFLRNRTQAVEQVNRSHAVSFPFDSQFALAVWRVFYFKPRAFKPDQNQSAAWNRGAYLVQGLAHCGACHSTRNALGAPVAGHAYDGAMMPGNDWYAPSLTAASEASVANWSLAEIAAWLKDGATPKASALGPMAEVIFQSTQYANNADLLAMATYLKALPSVEPTRVSNAPAKLITQRKSDGAGAALYAKHCANCHGENGEGKTDAFPALAGNRAVTMANATNIISIIIKGGFAPATSGNPRPHGMPPYYHLLSDVDIAQLATHIRSSWGNAASVVTELDLLKYRNGLRGP